MTIGAEHIWGANPLDDFYSAADAAAAGVAGFPTTEAEWRRGMLTGDLTNDLWFARTDAFRAHLMHRDDARGWLWHAVAWPEAVQLEMDRVRSKVDRDALIDGVRVFAKLEADARDRLWRKVRAVQDVRSTVQIGLAPLTAASAIAAEEFGFSPRAVYGWARATLTVSPRLLHFMLTSHHRQRLAGKREATDA